MILLGNAWVWVLQIEIFNLERIIGRLPICNHFTHLIDWVSDLEQTVALCE
jgi:hypothetical protein